MFICSLDGEIQEQYVLTELTWP